MAKYNLLPNEAVLLREDGIFHGKGLSGELILTNVNLVIMKEGLFGGSKGSRIFPLNQIKVYNGRVQALSGKSGSVDVLQVYFLHGVEEFRFGAGSKKKVQAWIGKINEAVTGEPAPLDTSTSHSGAEAVVAIVKDTLGAFKSAWGGKNAGPASAPTSLPVPVATKCNSCGSSLSGMQGQSVTCSYCDVSQKL
jgi:hypothetical protein